MENADLLVYRAGGSKVDAPNPDQENGYYPAGRVALAPVPHAVGKRILDVIFAVLALALLSPLFLAIAIIIRLTSRGPVLFRQTRIGAGGRAFTCYKFRSMYPDAERRLEELRDRNEVPGPVFKMSRDPRITPIGRFLRKSSLDEFPQFYNVLRGDMSVVGPRPPIPAEVLEYTLRERRRLSVRPGLTCTWQVSGWSLVAWDRWVEMDLDYIQSMSLAEDISLIVRTIPAVLTARGSH